MRTRRRYLLIIGLGCSTVLGMPGRNRLAKHGVAIRAFLSPRARRLRAPTRRQPYLSALPLAFEKNVGQARPNIRFLARGQGYTVFLAESKLAILAQSAGPNAVMSSDHILQAQLERANPNARLTSRNRLPGWANYFIGNNPHLWHTRIPMYSTVLCRNIYPGIDLKYYGHTGRLEADFLLHPGSQINRIRLRLGGRPRLDQHGDLVLSQRTGEFWLMRPRAYQISHGRKQWIPAAYYLARDGNVGLQVAAYNHRQMLVIDPTLVYATYLGGSGSDNGNGITVDTNGNVYIVGTTTSTDFPVTSGAYKTTYPGGGSDAFVTKLSADGSTLLYSTYLGGSTAQGFAGANTGSNIAIDSSGNAYISGQTGSIDFPVTSGVVDGSYSGGTDRYVSKISSDGSSLIYSTYLGGGGTDIGEGLALDSQGDAFIAGRTSGGYPVTTGAFQAGFGGATWDGFITKLNPTATAYVYSTYLGGSGNEKIDSVAVDNAGNAYVTGWTTSSNFPVTAGAFDTTLPASGFSTFLTELNASGSGLVDSTYLGGSGGEIGEGVAVDDNGNAYLAGLTVSSDFPITTNALQAKNASGGNGTCFITKFPPGAASMTYSTYLGGSGGDICNAIAVDSGGNMYVTGQTQSSDFPVTSNAFQASYTGNADSFVSELDSTGDVLNLSSYLGGTKGTTSGNSLAVDSSGAAYLTGTTSASDFPTTTGVYEPSSPGTPDAFVVKVPPSLPAVAISPSSLSFGPQIIGTTSNAQTVTVTDSGSAGLGITGVSVSGDYAETDNCSGNVVAPGASCTINVTFTPTSVGTKSGTLTISDNALGSPQTVPLSGSGSSVEISPTTLSFGAQVVTSTSSAKTVTLTNAQSAALTITAISTSGDFSETNNCGASLTAQASCTINVSFTPTTVGARSGTLSLSDNAAGSPQTIALMGTGSDFNMNLSAGSTPTVTINAGSSADFGLVFQPMSAFNGTIALSCSGAPQAGTCSALPAQFSLSGNANADADITVTTMYRHSVVPPPPTWPSSPRSRWLWIASLLVALGIEIRFVFCPARRRRVPRLAARIVWLVPWLLLLVSATGCSVKLPPGTPAGIYHLQIVGTAQGTKLSHTQSLTLVVK